MVSIDNIDGVEPGQLYTKNGKDVWEVKSYFSRPSLILKNLHTGEEMNGGVGCLNFKSFEKLVPAKALVNHAPMELEFAYGLPDGTTVQYVDDGEWEVRIPGDHAVYCGLTKEQAIKHAKDRVIRPPVVDFEKSFPTGTTIRKMEADGRWQVAIHGQHAAFYYGDTRVQAVNVAYRALNRHGA